MSGFGRFVTLSPSHLVTTACAHCGLPVPSGLLVQGETHQFCCTGCKTVFTLIHSCNLDRYYQYRAIDEAGGATPAPAKTTSKAYREFAFPTFLSSRHFNPGTR